MMFTCFVCDAPAQEFHFGSISRVCRACSAFFRRFVLSPKTSIVCRRSKKCCTHFSKLKFCRFCRMKRCVDAGMKIEAVQPRRDKTGKDKSSPENFQSGYLINYSFIENINEIQTCSQRIPRIDRICQQFQVLEKARRSVFKNDGPPMPRNMDQLLVILKDDLKLVTKFAENVYPEIENFGKLEKRHVLINFFIKYMLIESPFVGFLTGCKEFLLVNGDFYNSDIGSFYTSHLESADTSSTGKPARKISKESAEKLFKPYWDEYRRTVIEEVWFTKLDVIEFLTLASLILWDTGLEGISEKSVTKAQNMRMEIIDEVQFYYRHVKKIREPCLRLAQIMMLLASVQRSFGKYQDELEMCGFFEINQQIFDGEDMRLINESLQIS